MTALRIWLACLAITAVLIVLWISVDLFLLIVLPALLVWVAVLYAQRDEARAEWGAEVFKVAIWKAKAESLEREAEQLHLLLTEAERAVARVPLLKSVPASREVSDYQWPAIMRAVEGGEES